MSGTVARIRQARTIYKSSIRRGVSRDQEEDIVWLLAANLAAYSLDGTDPAIVVLICRRFMGLLYNNPAVPVDTLFAQAEREVTAENIRRALDAAFGPPE
jgi:hypothetical protein